MRYHLPPPSESSRAHGITPVAPAGGAVVAHTPEPAAYDIAEGRILRTVRLTTAEAGPYLRRWESDAGTPAHAIPVPAGTARERRRADRTMPGTMRRQRLAVVRDAAGASALHWSAPEPVLADDEAVWERALARAAAGTRDAGGWTA